MAVRHTNGLTRPLARGMLLLGSGAMSSIAIAAFAAGKVLDVPPVVVSPMLRLISLQVVAVTIGKWGGDSLAFALASADLRSGLNIWRRAATKCIPAGIVAAIVLFSMGRFPLIPILVATASVAADIVAVQLVADLNARGKIGVTAVATAMNYPLFVLSVMFFARNGETPGLQQLVCMFAASSAARLLWCSFIYRRVQPVEKVDSNVDAVLAGQQCLNVYAYKADQILVGALGLMAFGGTPKMESYFLYMVRFPELIGSAVTGLGPIYLPLVYTPNRIEWSKVLRRFGLAYGVPACVVLIAAAIVFCRISNKAPESVSLDILPFALAGALSAPVYALSYSMIRSNSIGMLVKILAMAGLLGLVLAVAAIYLAIPRAIFWTVPIQLSAVLVLAGALNWNRASPSRKSSLVETNPSSSTETP